MRIPKGCCQLGRADGNASCKEALADGQDESAKLVPVTVELDNPGGSETPRVCLSGTKMQIGEVESHRSQADESRGQANKSRGRVDASTVLNTCETVAMDDSDGTGARLDAGDARRDRVGPDGHANWSDVLSGHRDVPDIRNSMNTTTDTKETISTRPEDTKAPDLPTGSTRSCPDETDRLESHAGMQMACIHVQDIGNESNEPENTSVTQNLPANGTELCMGEPNRLEIPMDMLDTYTCMQRVVDNLRRPTDNSECIRKFQNGCKRSNLPAKSLKTRPEEPEKPGNRADASSTCTNVQSDQSGTKRTAKPCETVSKSSKKPKMPNSPIGPKIWCRGEGNGLGNHADGSNVCRDTQRIEMDTKMAENVSKNVKMCQVRPRRPNSPCRIKIETAKRPERWKHVSNNGDDGYTPQIALIKDLGTQI